MNANTPSLTIQIIGQNVLASSKVEVNGSPRITRFKSAAELEADLEVADVAVAAILQVLVRNPEDDGGRGGSHPLTVA
jgi:hypothetical protein